MIEEWFRYVAKHPNLSPTDKFFAFCLYEMREIDEKNGQYYAEISQYEASKAYKIGTKTVYRAARKLSSEGIISIMPQQGKGFRNQPNRYYIITSV
jgi:DNA-binding PadR family transcriptional regulator